MTARVTGAPQLCTFTAFPMSSPTGSPPFTVTNAHMSRQDRVARVKVQETVNTTFSLITGTSSQMSLLARAFIAFLPGSCREKVPSSYTDGETSVTASPPGELSPPLLV